MGGKNVIKVNDTLRQSANEDTNIEQYGKEPPLFAAHGIDQF